MSSYPALEDFAKKLREATPTPEDIQNLSNSINKITKASMKLPMSWEALAGNKRTGHYEPYGIKWVQWVGWAAGFVLFWIWRSLERVLDKSRHFSGVSGYEWEDAEY